MFHRRQQEKRTNVSYACASDYDIRGGYPACLRFVRDVVVVQSWFLGSLDRRATRPRIVCLVFCGCVCLALACRMADRRSCSSPVKKQTRNRHERICRKRAWGLWMGWQPSRASGGGDCLGTPSAVVASSARHRRTHAVTVLVIFHSTLTGLLMSGSMKAVWLDIFGPVFFGFWVETESTEPQDPP